MSRQLAASCSGCNDTLIEAVNVTAERVVFSEALLNFDDKVLESCLVIGLLALVVASNLVFCIRPGRPAAVAAVAEKAADPEVAGAVDSDAGVAADAGCQSSTESSGAETEAGCQASAKKPERVDTKALTGLRGLAALHVALGHYSVFWGPDLLGGASMGFFYMLSGYIMALGYAKEPRKAADGGEPSATSSFDNGRFLRNRFARLYPSYLLLNVVSLFLGMWIRSGMSVEALAGYPRMLPTNFCLTLVGLNMWIWPINAWIADKKNWVDFPTELPAWTMQTMFMFYLVFGRLLPWLQGVRRRRATLLGLYWLQALTFVALVLAGRFLVDSEHWGYVTARSWPWSRLPVFVMGCLSAVERVRGDGAGRSLCLGLWCGRQAGATSQKAWGRRATVAAAVYVVIVAAACTLMRMVTPRGDEWLSIRSGVEAFMPLLFLDLIGALTRCGDEGLVARFCRCRPMQEFGEVSMTFYLTHLLVLHFVSKAFVGTLDSSLLPLWLFPVCFSASVLVGWLLAHYFEGPCRRLLRG